MENEDLRLFTTMPHRVLCLEKWLKMREYQLSAEQYNFLCIYYCTLLSYHSAEAAKKYTREINKRLLHPLSDYSLNKSIFERIDKQTSIFRFTNQCIKEKLGITEAEYEALGFDVKKRELAGRAQRKQERIERNELIKLLYRQGKSRQEIQMAAGVSIKTVERVISDIAAVQKDIRNLTIVQLHKEGKTNIEIAEELGCNRDTVSAVLKTEPGLKKRCKSAGNKKAQSRKAEQEHGNLYAMYREQVERDSAQCENADAYRFLSDTKENLLIYGSAGTGKSSLVNRYIDSLPEQQRKKVLLVAPTWKAASILGGITVHSAFQIGLSVQEDVPVSEIPKHLLKYDTVIIDEISQLRVDVTTRMIRMIKAMEQQKRHPVRVIAIGDFGQLAPVVLRDDAQRIKAYYPASEGVSCYHSPLWNSLNFKKVPLMKIYRQEDTELSDYLCMLKYGCKEAVDWFNHHCSAGEDAGGIYLCTTNASVDYYNQLMLSKQQSQTSVTYAAQYEGMLPEELPIEKSITLGIGYRVLFLWKGKEYRKGELGTVVSVEKDCIHVRMDTTGKEIKVYRHTWILEDGVEYRQFPVCLGFAITVHKSQGCTFQKVNIVRGSNGFFLPGQLYVALSRCRTVNGIHLVEPLQEKDLFVDEEALKMTLC